VPSKSQQSARSLFALTPVRAVPYTAIRISRQGDGEMRRRMFFAAATAMVAVVAAGTGLAGQTKDQQSCVNDMNKYGERVVKSQDGTTERREVPGPLRL